MVVFLIATARAVCGTRIRRAALGAGRDGTGVGAKVLELFFELLALVPHYKIVRFIHFTGSLVQFRIFVLKFPQKSN